MSEQIYLFHKDKPAGQLFDREYADSNFEQLIDDGWVDSPASLEIDADTPVITKEQSQNIGPDELIGLVKHLGYVVMTPVEFDAALEKAKNSAYDELLPVNSPAPEPTVDNTPVAEPYNPADLWKSGPEKMTKEELVEYGKRLNLNVTRSMNESTLIEKIQAVLSQDGAQIVDSEVH